MPKANELKRGLVVGYNDRVYIVRDIEKSAPTARGGQTLYRVRMDGVPDMQKADVTFKADDLLREVDLARRPAQFSYKDGDSFVFMDAEDFTQYALDPDVVGDATDFITESLEGLVVMVIDDTPVGLQLPQSVVLQVAETPPELKGSSATKRTKTATLSTGLEIQVPEYIASGEWVKVNTETREFMGRAG